MALTTEFKSGIGADFWNQRVWNGAPGIIAEQEVTSSFVRLVIDDKYYTKAVPPFSTSAGYLELVEEGLAEFPDHPGLLALKKRIETLE